jgi:hypothetical protein
LIRGNPIGAPLLYGANFPDIFRRAAEYIDRILRGEKTADLPVQAPTKYVLAPEEARRLLERLKQQSNDENKSLPRQFGFNQAQSPLSLLPLINSAITSWIASLAMSILL